jgi:predicted ribosomally synthesized peptide with nif11-like leader
MSVKSAIRFLQAATQDEAFRGKFGTVSSPDEFLQVSHRLGYSFTTEELRKVVTHKSRSVVTRRTTGVWPWLRDVNWLSEQAAGRHGARSVISKPVKH